jgi:hypothetical protein
MKRRELWVVATLVALLSWVPSRGAAETNVDVRVRVGDPYRGASLDFNEEPAVVLVPATKVYYVRDHECDLYRFGRYWYFVENERWYRSRTWQGPFLHLNATSVPKSVRTVPLNYRRHWYGPPPRAVAQGYVRK